MYAIIIHKNYNVYNINYCIYEMYLILKCVQLKL